MEGEVQDEEVDIADIDLKEDGVIKVQVQPWTVAMLVYSLERPTPQTLFDNLEEAWRLEDMDYTFLGDNKYLVHFGCEADMARILKGEPWQYKHNPLIMEAYDGTRKLSEYKLDAIRIWVHILDVPMNWRTDAIVRALCKNLGTVMQNDLGDGNSTGRVRVALPVYRALETIVAMNARVKEKLSKVEFKLQYERLPWFCYTCGFLGHQDKSCGR